MKKKFLACGLAACAALVALALPTKKEVQAARPIVAELMADAVAEQRAGKIKTAELGARALALADRAETEAARLLLLQGAVMSFARGGEPERAAQTVRKMRGEIKGITPEYEADMLSRAVKSLPLKDGRLLYGMLDDARRLVRYRREVATLEKSLAVKDDPAKRAQLAERLAALGEWKRALEEIAKLDGDVARAAKFELGEGAMTSAEVAEIWWRQSGMKDADGFTVFQRHAGEWYVKALSDGSLTGLKRDLAQKRIDDMGGIENFRGSGTLAASGKESNALYCVIDLSTGPSASRYPVKWLVMPPPGGFNTDEYKTKKLVLRRIEPGKFMMGGKHEVTLTKPFYCGVFEVTQKQYELVTGGNPSEFKGDMRPVEKVSWNAIRGDSSTYNWPSSANVDSSTFIGKLQTRTGLKFDLPTEAQWEYVCRAGTTSKYNNGGDSETDLKKLGRFALNQKKRGYRESDADLARHEPDGKGGCLDGHTVVGSYQPNAWELYDMHGNVWEWCLDWKGNLSGGVTDPQGSSSGSGRMSRGGAWNVSAVVHCASSHRLSLHPSRVYHDLGFRLCMNPEGPVGASAQGSAAHSASPISNEKLPKETSARPNPLVLDLGGGVKMEMVGCPAGAFMMGYDASKPEYTPHEVTITRPFWMGRFPVTVEQWGRVMQPIAMLKQKIVNAEAVFDALGGQKLPQIYCKSVDVDEFITLVNKKFANHLPKGYVFRLATWAEWEYAGRANGTPGRDWFALPWGMKGQERHIVSVQDRINALEAKSVRYREEDISSGAESLPFRVGTKSANQWGLEDMWGNVNELLMDRLSPRVPLPSWGIATIPSEFLDWNGKNRDPLFWNSSANANGSVMQATRWGWGRRFAWRRDRGGWMGFRLCVGPDLLKERGITPPKLGK